MKMQSHVLDTFALHDICPEDLSHHFNSAYRRPYSILAAMEYIHLAIEHCKDGPQERKLDLKKVVDYDARYCKDTNVCTRSNPF
jgi:hypothetical protein